MISAHRVDSAIAEWTTRHRLVLTKSFGGRAVRNVYISSATADVFQIWVDDLAAALDEVLRVVEPWMHPSHRHVPAGAGV
jgi:hypothetical protein